MGAKTGFDKFAERLDHDSKINVIGNKVSMTGFEDKHEDVAEEEESPWQWTVMLPGRYKQIVRELKFVTARSYKDLCLEALDYLAEKHLGKK